MLPFPGGGGEARREAGRVGGNLEDRRGLEVPAWGPAPRRPAFAGDLLNFSSRRRQQEETLKSLKLFSYIFFALFHFFFNKIATKIQPLK